MFICKKAEFEVDNVAFSLPKNMLLDMTSCDVLLDGFHLIAPDESFEIELYCYSSECDVYSALASLIGEETGYILNGTIKHIGVGGFDGYVCCYCDNFSEYTEYEFDISGGKHYNRLNICVTARKQEKLCFLLKEMVINELLESIRRISI